MRGPMRPGWAAGVFACLALSATTWAIAQTPDSPPATPDRRALQEQADILFKKILVDPKNLDLTFRYAEISSALGDYESSIGALERMLYYNKDLPRVELELGLIYFRLGSYEMARSHFEKAVSGADTPDEVRQRVDAFQREIDRRLSANQFALMAQLGLRYQSNANAGPDSALVRALGNDATLSSQFLRQGDWNHFGLVTARHVYDFENQRGDTWESGITAYYAGQWSATRLNLGLIEVDTGPRLTIGEGPGLSVRPYALGNVITLADRNYLNTVGGGVSARWQGDWLQIEPGVEYRSRRYQNSGAYPTATDQTGNLWIGSLAGMGPLPIITGLRWQAKLSTQKSETAVAGLAYSQYGLEVTFPFEFQGFFGPSDRAWTFTPSVAWNDTRYAAPYAIVDPNTTRHDNQLILGAGLDIGLYRNIGLAVQVQYMRTMSNIPNYRTTDFVVAAGPTIRY